VALRTSAGRAVGWFDDDFFLYYEDTDLSWRPARGRLGDPVRADRRRAPRPLRHQRRVVAHLRLPHRPQPPADAGEERDGGGRCASAARYPLTTGSMALRTVRTSLRGAVPARGAPTLMRLKVLLSFLRLLPTMLAKRGRRRTTVPRRRLESGW
jgi:hypothetical protein